MAESAEEIRKHVRVYLLIGATLLILTAVTVWASYLDLNPAWTIVVALVIATVKASLVAGFFMHLLSEKQTIYLLLFFTGIFFIFVFLIPIGQYKGDLTGIEYTPTKNVHASHAQEEGHH